MSKNTATAPKERIIPIQIEGSDSQSAEVDENNSKSDTQQEKLTQEKASESDGESENVITPSLLEGVENPPEIIEETPPDRTLPIYNAREKIVIVLDRAEDDHCTPFKHSNNGSSMPLITLKKSLEIFLKWKTSINKKHEFALVVLDENSATWCLDFTSSVDDILNKLDEITICEAEDIFNLNSLFDVLMKNITLPAAEDLSIPPRYIVRTVLLYSRSYTVPQLDSNEKIESLLTSPYFTLDVLMTHEPIGSDNNCNKIFQILQNLDKKGFAYFLPVSRNLRLLYSSMGILLSHPMQRPFKNFAEYNIKDISG